MEQVKQHLHNPEYRNILLMAAITAVILILVGINITISVIVAIVLIFPFAWIEEHFMSRYINALVGRVLKYRAE